MTKIRLFPSLVGVAVLLAACAPGTGTAPPDPLATEQSAATLPPSVTLEPAAPTPASAVSPTPLPLATSRGPELHATDPETVSLASGGLQLVEFFRFT